MGKGILLAGLMFCGSLPFATDARAQAVDNPASERAARTGPSADAGQAVGTDTAQRSDTLEEIVVTAQKRDENLQRVPIAITALPAARLESVGVTTTQNLAAALPGLQLLNVLNQLSPRIRGIGSSFASPGLESPVATYVDGVYYASGSDLVLDFADVSQVALLKGPQGTLFGRNATGGVLQITTRDTTDEFRATVLTSIDNYETWRSNAFISGRLAAGVAASLSASYTRQGEGYGTNVATGNDTYKIDDSFSVRGKIRFEIGDRTTIRLQGDYSEHSGAQAPNFQTFPGRSSVFPSPQPRRKWDTNKFHDTVNEYQGGGASLTAAHEFGFATLTTISAFRRSTPLAEFTNIPSATPTAIVRLDDISEQFTQEIQLVSPSSGRFTWTIGAYYFDNTAVSDFTIDNFGSFAVPFARLLFPARQETSSIAGFAQATYRLAESTRVTAGFRYTDEKREFAAQSIGLSSATGARLVLFNSGDQKISFAKPAWRLSLDQDLVEDILGYVSYNRGVKSGGFSVRAAANPAFNPEQLDAYEAGVKSELFGRKVRLNVGGFFYDYKNIQVPIYTGTQTLILNGAEARIYGADVDVEARLTDRLRVNASANYLHSRFRDFPNAPFAVPRLGNQGAVLSTRSAEGRTLPNSPSLTYTLGADYTIPSPIGEFSLNVNDSYNDGFFAEVDNILRQGSYHFIGASIRWQSPDTRYSVRLYVNNLLNEAVFSQALSANAAYLADYSNPPRIIGASVQVAW
ncbi:TonB-dependent receptor [uncultured Sphingomonas sp.]|uniref:TonB-dependent receptor n=1 Tax=uncultured Sphingomonas sp. TaxID=158754 RepID=UPI0035CAB0BD